MLIIVAFQFKQIFYQNLIFFSKRHVNGLNGSALWDVTKATLIVQLLYASPAYPNLKTLAITSVSYTHLTLPTILRV